MSNAVLERLCTERDEARSAAVLMAEADGFKPDDETYVGLKTRATELDTRITELSSLMDARSAADALDGRLSRAHKRQEEKSNQPEVRESWGEIFTRSEIFQNYAGHGTSSRLEIETRALPMTTTGWADTISAGPLVNLTPPETQNLVLALATTIPVTQNAVEYVTYAKVAGGADVVAEGAQKPSAEWAPTSESKSLQLIAVWTQLTRMLIEDANSVRAYVDQELRREVVRKTEAEAVEAITSATLPTVTGPADAGLLGAIRAGMAQVQAAGFQPSGFLVSSDDLISLDLAVMNTAGTAPNQTNSFWGLRPIIDTAGIVADGTVVVADFSAGVHHYTRTGVSLHISDSHESTFTRNIFTLLSESRSLTAVVRPAAMSESTAA